MKTLLEYLNKEPGKFKKVMNAAMRDYSMNTNRIIMDNICKLPGEEVTKSGHTLYKVPMMNTDWNHLIQDMLDAGHSYVEHNDGTKEIGDGKVALCFTASPAGRKGYLTLNLTKLGITGDDIKAFKDEER